MVRERQNVIVYTLNKKAGRRNTPGLKNKMNTLKAQVMEKKTKQENGKYEVGFMAQQPANEVSVISEMVSIKHLETFTQRLNAKPGKVDIALGFETIPISTVETELDEDFAGLWETENFRWQVIANEIVGCIDLKVFHPVARVWLKRSGTASVMIRQKKDADLQDIGAKIKNGLVMDFPKLEIMCIKSAAKKIGEKYGRSLNRKWIDTYETIYSDEIESSSAIDDIGERMKGCKTIEELLKIWAEFPDMHTNTKFKQHFTSYRAQLNLKK